MTNYSIEALHAARTRLLNTLEIHKHHRDDALLRVRESQEAIEELQERLDGILEGIGKLEA